MTHQYKLLKFLGGEDTAREVCTTMVYAHNGVLYDAQHDFPYKVIPSNELFMGWGDLDGEVVRLVSDYGCDIETARHKVEANLHSAKP